MWIRVKLIPNSPQIFAPTCDESWYQTSKWKAQQDDFIVGLYWTFASYQNVSSSSCKFSCQIVSFFIFVWLKKILLSFCKYVVGRIYGMCVVDCILINCHFSFRFVNVCENCEWSLKLEIKVKLHCNCVKHFGPKVM